jgi:hypothetical protein
MDQKKDIIHVDLNGDLWTSASSPSQPQSMKPAPVAGFRFLSYYGDMKGTKIENVHYRRAKLMDKGSKWFVYYSYLGPDGRFKRYKVYEDINRIEDLGYRREYGNTLIAAVNHWLTAGHSPYDQTMTKDRVTFIQALNEFKTKLYGRGLRKRTVQSYESVLRSIYEGMKPHLLTDVRKISKANISSYLKETANKNQWSNATYNIQLLH